jgi:Uma2 family endonuclease
MSASGLLTAHDDTPTEDHSVRLRGVSWEDYERWLEIRGESAVPRLTYLEGDLEFMSPSKSHEGIKSLIGRLVEVFCLDRGIELIPYGSWTLKEKDKKSGLEPDECYVFGNLPTERPHLAIEVEWTRRDIDKLEAYRRLGVGEIWIWRRGAITVHLLENGRYTVAQHSLVLPDLDLALLASCLDRPTLTQAVREFRAALAQKALTPNTHDPVVR